MVYFASLIETSVFSSGTANQGSYSFLFGHIFIYPFVLLATHRLILLSDPSFLIFISELFRSRTVDFWILYLKYVFALSLVSLIFFVPLLAVLDIRDPDSMTMGRYLGLPFAMIIAYFCMRLGLAFPMCALDKATGLRRSWNASRGRGVSLWVLGLLVGLPIVIPHIVLSQFAFNTLEASNETAQILASLTSSVFDTLYYVLGAISLSLAYRQLGLDKQV